LWYQLEKIFEADPDAKVLIYTRWRYMLDILADVLPFRSVQYHGDLTAGGKAAVVAEFGRDPEIRLFISSHAGAYGCDMFMANHLVNYDRDWSAGKGDQINGRPMRASSEFSKVWVHDMECTGTIEKWKRDVLTFKRRLSSAVVDGEGMDSSGHITNDVQSLTTWLDHTICPR
jgi:SNF2 family DNA or RNA helicase